ncbi:M48 family metallopeptidase [Sphingopyxis sp. JAI128]|uniref:tetratricopeptide repeat protein n=1 Tax=Sphingopyxis sp. JAI128 TaxID=2723066 RepID=UPI001615147F|nr:tetratricopeptide repeat protein [Sphingopyxis sp. JAI128]MBB6427465.1 tetratricopeptide (TPR) repeat protein [Sphingopyxis sp. JAI128]
MDHAKANEAQSSAETDRIIAEELERLLESPMFVRSPVLSRLLQFLVEHRLRGGRSAPKAYAIATEALGRSEDFDPAVDSYPRVMVGRLRTLLDRYYADTPWIHRLRVPQGSYEVVVQHRSAPPMRSSDDAAGGDDVKAAAAAGSPDRPVGGALRPSASGPAFGRWLVVLALLIVALSALWTLRGGPGRLFVGEPVPVPLIEISAPQAGNSPESRALARALDGKLRDGLRRFALVDLLSAKAPGAATPRTGDYRLDASLVRRIDGSSDITLVLNRVADQRTIWSQLLRVGDEDTPEYTGLEPAIAQIAGDYGVIVRDQVERQPDNFSAGYPCLAQFNRVRQLRNKASVKQVDSCLRATLRGNPRDSAALAALSLLRYGDWQPARGTAAGSEALTEARSLAERSYESSPNAAAGLFAMARAHFYAGNCAAGNAMGDAALALNRYDADMSGFLGLFKVSCAMMPEGEALLRRSLALDSSHPGVPAVTLAFILSQRGEQEEAQSILNHMPSPTNMEPQYMMVRSIVLARRGRLPEARAQWRQLLDYTRQPASAAPEVVVSRFVIAPVVVQRAAAALRESGVVPAPAAR